MGSWLKLFTDGTSERGSDKDVDSHKASWTLGRHKGLCEVRLFHDLKTCSLSVPDTNWHQFDRFSVIVSEGRQEATRTHRVVQAEIFSSHIGLYLICSNSYSYYSWTVVRDLRDTDAKLFHRRLTKKHAGQWLTLILPAQGYPMTTFSVRGKMHANNKPIS